MTVVNRQSLLIAQPIVDMLKHKQLAHGVSHGLTEAGYDIRIKQDVVFKRHGEGWTTIVQCPATISKTGGRFALASTMERFQMPANLLGIVHDKSTWARRGLSVFNTIIEPGWEGYLTLELMYHGEAPLHIPAGSGIAQVLFHEVAHSYRYHGKYQNQADGPVAAIAEKG